MASNVAELFSGVSTTLFAYGQTGSGKTVAFLLPLIARVAGPSTALPTAATGAQPSAPRAPRHVRRRPLLPCGVRPGVTDSCNLHVS